MYGCSASSVPPYPLASDNSSTPSTIGKVRCASCHLLISQPQASADEITTFYRDAYYAGEFADAAAVDRETEALHNRYDIPLMQQLWADWPPPPAASVVDIGCGYGSVFAPFGRLGYRVVGCEPSLQAVAYCRSQGRDVREGVIPDVQFDELFDVTVSLQVIEHVTDVRGFVRALVAATRPGGIVVITT